MTHVQVLTIIRHLRGDDPIIEEVFTRGNCGNLALALSIMIPNSRAYKVDNDSHVVVHYDGRLYDIRGDVTAIYPTIGEPYDLVRDGMYDGYDFEFRGPAY